jgi:23S rRNA pseudouridine2605 synthase
MNPWKKNRAGKSEPSGESPEHPLEERDSSPMRIARYLSQCGIASRRKAEELVDERRVQVNGVTLLEKGTVVTPGVDLVLVDGKPVELPTGGEETWMYHKPIEVLVTTHDPQGRPTVFDYLPVMLRPLKGRLKPVGRLDFMSEGLLLLTTDGNLANRLMHPRYEVEKEYEIVLREEIDSSDHAKMIQGVLDEGERLMAKVVEQIPVLSTGEEIDRGFGYRVVLGEGRNRHIRRMLTALGKTLYRLRRIRSGSIVLGNLQPGGWRKLRSSELVGLIEGDVE